MTFSGRAIILSAGQGRRLLPLTESRPKALIPLAGRSVVGWQLRHLEAAGVREALVVTGFAAEAIEADLKTLGLTTLRVETLFNPFYALADNLASCWIAREAFAGEVLLLNGDTLFETAIAERLIAAPAAEIVVTVDRKAAYDADDMKIQADGDRLTAIGKTLSENNAESIGFLRFSADGAARFRAAVETAMRDTAALKRWYLSIIHELAQDGDGVRICSIEGLDWGEIDFLADVERAEALAAGWAARQD